jgi:hypothetical protein
VRAAVHVGVALMRRGEAVKVSLTP